jgi:transcriptional regulator with XRE-family HTH domain
MQFSSEGRGRVLLFRKRVVAHGSGSDLLAKDAPGDIRPQLFADDDAAALTRGALDARAVLGRDAGLQPPLDGLMPVILDVKNPGGLDGAAKHGDCPFCGSLGGRVRVHASKCTQDFLASPVFLAFRDAQPHEKLAGMSIHEAIKARRLALKLSQEALAKKVSELDATVDPISRQTVQHWENGTTAPKRTRLPIVAAALETTAEALMGGHAAGDHALSDRALRFAKEYEDLNPREQQRFDLLLRAARDIGPATTADASQPVDAMLGGESGLGGLDELPSQKRRSAR